MHHSPKADEARAEIQSLISAGRTDDQIRAALVERYSLRVLATPPSVRGQWLNWIPRVALVMGIVVVGAFIRQSLTRSGHAEAEPAPNVEIADLDAD